ncbi:TolC family protein [Chrysiogenes arsenatis]|uniref:TolC family protein n=1 Tax=Chrysiogenes arsenatis TaxID=309797 RepID=UPI0004133E3C|nr:TolC family protein [Chrysiogenes arsenatis]
MLVKRSIISLLIPVLAVSSSVAFTLHEGFLRALENNTDLLVRKNNTVIIDRDIDAARALVRPRLDAIGRMQREELRDSGNSFSDYRRNTSHWELILTQPLYDGGDAQYERSLQESRRVSAEYYLREISNQTALRYVEAYLTVLQEQALLKLANDSWRVNKDIFEKVKRKVDSGHGTRLELERSLAKLNEATVNMTVQRKNFRESLVLLRDFVQTEVSADELVLPRFYAALPNSLDDALRIALLEHPSMKVSLNNISVALYEYRRDDKRMKPAIDLISRYRQGDEIPSVGSATDEFSVGIEVRYNIYRGGRDQALGEKGLRYVEEKKILLQQTEQQIENRLRLAWNTLEMGESNILSAKDFAFSKGQVLRTTLTEFDLGTVDLNSVLEAEEESVNAQKMVIRAEFEAVLAKYRVLEGTGALAATLVRDEGRFGGTVAGENVTEVSRFSEPSRDANLPVSDSQRGFSDSLNRFALDWSSGSSVPFGEPKSVGDTQQGGKSEGKTVPIEKVPLEHSCYTVTAQQLNHRAAPDRWSAVVGLFTFGEQVCGGKEDSGWVRIGDGWLRSRHLQPINEGYHNSSPEELITDSNKLMVSHARSKIKSSFTAPFVEQIGESHP